MCCSLSWHQCGLMPFLCSKEAKRCQRPLMVMTNAPELTVGWQMSLGPASARRGISKTFWLPWYRMMQIRPLKHQSGEISDWPNWRKAGLMQQLILVNSILHNKYLNSLVMELGKNKFNKYKIFPYLGWPYVLILLLDRLGDFNSSHMLGFASGHSIEELFFKEGSILTCLIMVD